jgi:hypothetical protein
VPPPPPPQARSRRRRRRQIIAAQALVVALAAVATYLAFLRPGTLGPLGGVTTPVSPHHHNGGPTPPASHRGGGPPARTGTHGGGGGTGAGVPAPLTPAPSVITPGVSEYASTLTQLKAKLGLGDAKLR